VDFPDEQILLLLPDSCDIIPSLGEMNLLTEIYS